MSDKGAAIVAVPSDAGSKVGSKVEGEAPSLGGVLAGARERKGATREDVVRETRIPDHYLRMMESNDYSMISDQLYMLPFLRRYAAFLSLDPEEVGMRFVREVQRADGTQSARTIEPIEMDRRRRRNWTGPVIAAALVAVLIGAWLAQSRHRHLAGPTAAANAATR